MGSDTKSAHDLYVRLYMSKEDQAQLDPQINKLQSLVRMQYYVRSIPYSSLVQPPDVTIQVALSVLTGVVSATLYDLLKGYLLLRSRHKHSEPLETNLASVELKHDWMSPPRDCLQFMLSGGGSTVILTIYTSDPGVLKHAMSLMADAARSAITKSQEGKTLMFDPSTQTWQSEPPEHFRPSY